MVARGVAGDRLCRNVGGMTYQDFAIWGAARLIEIQQGIIWSRNKHKNTSAVRGRGLKRSFEVFGEQWLAGSMLI